jgi:hypothetical protein
MLAALVKYSILPYSVITEDLFSHAQHIHKHYPNNVYVITYIINKAYVSASIIVLL